jgi:hypothetical protein
VTRSQFAQSVRASEKWVANTAAILSRPFAYTVANARWLGLVRVLTEELKLELSHAATLAEEALEFSPLSGSVTVGRAQNGVAGVTLDLSRYLSTFAAAHSAAIEHGGERRRGRPRPIVRKKADVLGRAASYGVDVDLLREGLKIPRRERLAQLDANAAFIASLREARR